MVFQELGPSQPHKAKNRSDLEAELFGGSEHGEEEGLRIRENEGEAAEYGIFFDDTEYDYMQHMRDIGGNGSGESYFIEALKKEKGKGKVKLEDALRDVRLDDTRSEIGERNDGKGLLDEDILPSKELRRTTYQDQQDIPDTLAGFQPDMDPRLREVLEALEDEAYIDDEEDLFGELAKEREEITLREFEELEFEGGDGEEDAGWETDDTAKPKKEYKEGPFSLASPETGSKIEPVEGVQDREGDWMAEYRKFKTDTKTVKAAEAATPSNAELQSSIMTGTSALGGRKKKRRGALTSSTGYSMTSSSLYRNEGLTLLDARFDKIEEEYADDNFPADDDDNDTSSILSGQISNTSGMSNLSNMSKISRSSSQAPSLVLRKDFDNIMDEFLGGYSMSGKRRVKKGGYQSGMEQLDEIRRELGKPRLGSSRA
jgi:protein LTV1